MPTDGYPIVLYAHGTTGDYRSYVFNGWAQTLTDNCIAVMGVDQIFQILIDEAIGTNHVANLLFTALRRHQF